MALLTDGAEGLETIKGRQFCKSIGRLLYHDDYDTVAFTHRGASVGLPVQLYRITSRKSGEA